MAVISIAVGGSFQHFNFIFNAFDLAIRDTWICERVLNVCVDSNIWVLKWKDFLDIMVHA